jgi:hypothetical protein
MRPGRILRPVFHPSQHPGGQLPLTIMNLGERLAIDIDERVAMLSATTVSAGTGTVMMAVRVRASYTGPAACRPRVCPRR